MRADPDPASDAGAIILGVAARRQIQRTGEGGNLLAATGLALGALWIMLALIVLLVLR